MKVVALRDFLELLRGVKVEDDRVRDFHLFILRKHDENLEVWPLAFTDSQGGEFMWAHIFRLWEMRQFSEGSGDES